MNLNKTLSALGILGLAFCYQFSSSLNAKIAQNHLGFQLGYGEISMFYADSDVPPVTFDNDTDGFAYTLEGNFNAYSPEGEQYGLDVPLRYLSGSTAGTGLDSDGDPVSTDFDLDVFQVLLRPYYKFDNLILFLDLGLNYINFDGDLNIDGTNVPVGKASKASFSGGFGFEYGFSESFSISPYVGWSESEMVSLTGNNVQFNFDDVDVFAISVPLVYSISEKLDVTLSYTYIDLDKSKVINSLAGGPDSVEVDVTFFGLGLGYKF